MMEYNYGLEPVSQNTMPDYLQLYKNHYGQQVVNADRVCEILLSYYDEGYLTHFACARHHYGKPVSAMGIVHDPWNDAYVFSHLVTHKDHRKKGIAKKVIFLGAKMLMAMEPTMIRNHKRMNVIPERYFRELGFKEEMVGIRNIPEYKLRFTWSNNGNPASQ